MQPAKQIPAPTPVTPPANTATAATDKKQLRRDTAASTPRSSAIGRFAFGAKPAEPAPEVKPVTPTATPTPAPKFTDVKPKPIMEADRELPAAPPEKDLPPKPTTESLPNHVVTQIDAMQNLPGAGKLITELDQASARKEALRQALSSSLEPARPKALNIAATTAALLIMGVYVWSTNYPKLALHSASTTAGFTASLPSYVPSSYSLSSKIAATVGMVQLNYQSPNNADFTITQHQTNWDASSLLANYVSKESTDYLAIQGEGLTIYMWNGNQATWVNHGIWYTIAGNTQLNRDQILQIAYSL
jgi:hypothetical protein